MAKFKNYLSQSECNGPLYLEAGFSLCDISKGGYTL